jgi:hypothetical protein
MAVPSTLLVAHELYPEFPPFFVVLALVIVVGGVLAVAGSKSRAREAEGGSFWRVPAIAFVACVLATGLSFLPPLDVIGSIILMPGFMLFWTLALQDVIPDNAGFATMIIVSGFASWAFWTGSALVILNIAGRVGGTKEEPSLSLLERPKP